MDVGNLAHEVRTILGYERKIDLPPPRKQRRGLRHSFAHERIRTVEPRDADLELLQRLELDRLESGHERPQQPLAALDRRRHRTDDVVARRERETALDGDEPVRRLEAGDAAPRCRDPDRPRRVAAESELDVARRDRRRRAAARPTRQAAGSDRVRNRAVVRVLGRDPVGELVEVRLPGDGVPVCPEPLHGLRAQGRHMLREERRPVRRRQPRRVEQVLDGHRLARARLVRARQPDPLH